MSANQNNITNPHRMFADTYLRQTPPSSESKKHDKNTNNTSYKSITYGTESSISKDLNSIYTNFVCSILLKNDCVLFGDFVIEFFSNNKLNLTKTIYAYGDMSFKNIIERDLYGKIYSKVVDNFTVYGYVQYKYKCISNNQIYDLVIYYLNYVQKIETQFVKENMLFNIDTLIISRNEIKALSWLNDKGDANNLDIPLPLGNLVEDITKHTFYINSKIKNMSQLQRCLSYMESGWTNASSLLLKEKQSQYLGKLCDICHDKINKNEKIITMKCKHFFHKDCWHETIKQHMTSNAGDIINCPTCRKTYYIHEVI
jgi:hypothetical protein